MATQDPRFLLTELIDTLHYRGVVEHFTEKLVSSRATSQLQNKGTVDVAEEPSAKRQCFSQIAGHRNSKVSIATYRHGVEDEDFRTCSNQNYSRRGGAHGH